MSKVWIDEEVVHGVEVATAWRWIQDAKAIMEVGIDYEFGALTYKIDHDDTEGDLVLYLSSYAEEDITFMYIDIKKNGDIVFISELDLQEFLVMFEKPAQYHELQIWADNQRLNNNVRDDLNIDDVRFKKNLKEERLAIRKALVASGVNVAQSLRLSIVIHKYDLLVKEGLSDEWFIINPHAKQFGTFKKMVHERDYFDYKKYKYIVESINLNKELKEDLPINEVPKKRMKI
jgi:hypothetical protein